MKVLREELLAAVELAAAVVVDHSITSFTKVWLRESVVSAFNGQIGVNSHVEDLPNVGGVDGKMLKQALAGFVDDEIELTTTPEGQLRLVGERSEFTFNVMDTDSYIDTNVGKSAPILRVPVAALEDFNMAAMVKLCEIKGDPSPAFTALSICPGEDRLILYASDRSTMNRSFWSIGDTEHAAVKAPLYIPLDYIKMLCKVWSTLQEGELLVTEQHVKVLHEGIELYSKMIAVDEHPNFAGVAQNSWPGGVFRKKLLVPIPDGFREAIDKASLLTTDKAADVVFRILDNELTISTQSAKGKFSETLTLEGEHANIDRKFETEYIKRVLPQVDRMYIGDRAGVFFGPLRFSTFIAARYA